MCILSISVKNSPAGEAGSLVEEYLLLLQRTGFNSQHPIAAHNWLFLKRSCPHFIHLVPLPYPHPRVMPHVYAHTNTQEMGGKEPFKPTPRKQDSSPHCQVIPLQIRQGWANRPVKGLPLVTVVAHTFSPSTLMPSRDRQIS